jgi:hypothetical protein
MVGVPIAVARAGGRSLQLYMPLAFWIVALLCALGAVFFVYRLCGKERPWWALVVPALVMGLLMQEWFAHPWLVLFHDFLVGGLPPSRAWDSVPLPTLFAKVFFGVGLNEELWKAIPIGICVWVARNIQGRWRPGGRSGAAGRHPGRGGLRHGVRGARNHGSVRAQDAAGRRRERAADLGADTRLAQQLTDVLAREACRAPNCSRRSLVPSGRGPEEIPVAQRYESLLLTLARMLGDICGHAAYSGYIGYFIGWR